MVFFAVFRNIAEKVYCKRKQYEKNGEEMKYGRME